MSALLPETSTLLLWLIESTLMVSILVCLIMAVRSVFLTKLPAWWIYSLWVLLIVRMLIPLNLETSLSVFNLIPDVTSDAAYIPYLQEQRLYMPFLTGDSEVMDLGGAGEVVEPINSEDAIAAGSSVASENNQPERNLSLEQILLLVWVSGAAVFALVILAKQIRFRAEIRGEPETADRTVLNLFAECKGLLGIKRKVALIATHKVKSPAIYGYLKPVLLLPPNIARALDKEQLSCVFLHELGHLKRHDIGVSWLAAMVQCVYWFNPLVWIAFHNMRSDQEAACDAFVLSRLEQIHPSNYASTIVNLLENYGQNRRVQALAGIVENKSQLKRRIKMIVDFKKRRPKETILSAVALVSIGFVLFSNPLSVSAQTDLSEVFQFRYEEQRSFSLSLPENWYSRPPGRPNELFRFSSPEDRAYPLIVFQGRDDRSVEEYVEGAQRSIAAAGWSDFVVTEGAVGSIRAIVLDFERAAPESAPYDRVYSRQYYVEEDGFLYVLAFGGPDPQNFEEFERIVASFEFSDEFSSNFASR